MDSALRNAVARIDVLQDGKSIARGTGTLVTDWLVLTALHVVADRHQNPPVPYEGTIRLSFPGHQTEAVIHEGHLDPTGDWVLLECADPPRARPMPLADLDRSGVDFLTFGFPDAEPRDGMVQTGTIENHQAELFGTPAFQLFSKQAAAGDGAPVKGLSGGPLIVDDALVGVLRFALMREGQAVAGTLYACPAMSVIDATGSLLPLPDPCHGLPGLPRTHLPPSPYRYLERFTADDAEIFFGRNREIRSLYDRLTDEEAAPVVLLFGQSGVGKSSFLDAGVRPRLRWSHEVRYVRRDPAVTLIETLATTVELPSVATGPLKPSEIAAAWRRIEARLGKPLVVILDQVEEVFTQAGDADGELAGLAAVLEEVFSGQAPRGKVVLSFRKEWFAEVQKQLETRSVDYSKVFLQGLDRDGIVEVVRGVTLTRRLRDHYGLDVEAALPELIADDLLADPDSPIAPTLQILLSRLWRAVIDDGDGGAATPRFTVAGYRQLQADGFLLSDFLDQQLDKLRTGDGVGALEGQPGAEQVDSGLALDLLACHTTPLLTAEQRDRQYLTEHYGHRTDVLPGLLQNMVDLYLLVDGGGRGGATRLAHDTLAPLVRMRFDESDRPGQRARRVLENRGAEWAGGRDGAVLDRADLATVEAGRPGMRSLGPDEQRLVAEPRYAATGTAGVEGGAGRHGRVVRRHAPLRGGVGVAAAAAAHQDSPPARAARMGAGARPGGGLGADWPRRRGRRRAVGDAGVSTHGRGHQVALHPEAGERRDRAGQAA